MDTEFVRRDVVSPRFDGRRALVTGAGKGIGREIARLLASSGAAVVAVSPHAGRPRVAAAETGCQTIVADIGEPAAPARPRSAPGPSISW